MDEETASALKPRKTPVQRRSSATVVAIFEAAIQVLLQQGFDRLTTTRVADRAGVSVGTLYQYFPNKRALLAAVIERYLDAIVSSVESVCIASHGLTVAEMLTAMCHAFIDAKFRRPDVSRALHEPAARLGGETLVRVATERSRRALVAMLQTASDASFEDLEMPSLMLVTATIGPVQAVLDLGAPPAALAALRWHLPRLCIGYMAGLAGARGRPITL